MKPKLFFNNAWELLKSTFDAFMDDNAMKLSASLSYYTIFQFHHYQLLYYQ